MASIITGGIKLFELSANLSVNGATISASTGASGASGCLDRNPDTYWRSVASTDLITETLTIGLAASTVINRILLLDINWKAFVIKYNVSGVWTHFASVYGMDGLKSNITETVFADSSAYYEFASVTTDQIQITITTTQVTNAQKYAAQIICTSELGTLAGYPDIKKIEISKNSRSQKTLSGKFVIQKSIETAAFTLDFKNYPRASTYNIDIALMLSLHDRENPFIVWLCGGRRGTSYFGYTLRGFRLQDAYVMQVSKALDLSYTKNIYKGQLNAKVELQEHI